MDFEKVLYDSGSWPGVISSSKGVNLLNHKLQQMYIFINYYKL